MPSSAQPAPVLATTAACLASLLLHPVAGGADRAPDKSAHPMGGGGSTVLERVPDAPAAPAPQRIVFTCVTPGLTTFSDRPCGPLPDRREIEIRSATADDGGKAPSVTPPPARASTKPAVVAGSHDPRSARRTAERPAGCEQLRHAVTAIDQQMRAGYSAREAPRLWERWREARDRLHAADCRR